MRTIHENGLKPFSEVAELRIFFTILAVFGLISSTAMPIGASESERVSAEFAIAPRVDVFYNKEF